MTRCRKCPQSVIDELTKVRESHDDERAKMKFGSQKAFFAKIWARLHDNRPYDPVSVRNVQPKAVPDDGSMPASNRTLQYPSGMSNNDMAFMAGQLPGQMSMMGQQAGQMSMMGGQMQMMGGGQHPGQMSMMGQQLMGGPQYSMGMGMMPHDMLMRGYGGYNNMAQFSGDGVTNGSAFSQPNVPPKKRGVDDDSVESNKRQREI